MSTAYYISILVVADLFSKYDTFIAAPTYRSMVEATKMIRRDMVKYSEAIKI